MKGRGRPSLPFTAWPEADRAAWERAMAPGSLFEPEGPAAALAPPTRRACLNRYGTYLGSLATRGEFKADEPGADRMTTQRLGRFIRDRALRPSTLFAEVAMLAMTMKVLVPERTWTWMRHHPLLPRRAERLASRRAHPIPEPATILRPLLAELRRLLAGPPTPDAARLARDHLLVAVGVVTGLRPRNLRELTLGETILRRPSCWEVVISGAKTKTRRGDLVSVIPGLLTESLDIFVARFHPPLGPSATDSGCPWLSGRGRGRCKAMMGRALERAGALAETPLRPHAAPHMMATEMLRHAPRAASTLRPPPSGTRTRRWPRFTTAVRGARAPWIRGARFGHGTTAAARVNLGATDSQGNTGTAECASITLGALRLFGTEETRHECRRKRTGGCAQ
jgi:integrase